MPDNQPQQLDAATFLFGNEPAQADSAQATPPAAPLPSPNNPPLDAASFLFGNTSQQNAQATTAPAPDAATGGQLDAASFLFDGGKDKPQPEPAPVTAQNLDAASFLFGGDNDQKSRPAAPALPSVSGVWGWLNTPLIDEQHVERFLGRDGQTNGVEKGIYDLAAGLTSPLQIALTLGTFGSGALIESGGAAALRAAGLGAEEISTVARGASVISDAVRTGRDTTEALEAAGLNTATVTKGLNVLQRSGMSMDSLLSGGLFRRGVGAVLRSTSVPIAKAENIARGIQALTDAGFTWQTASGALQAMPRALDALKDDDYDTAERLVVNAIGSGALAALGAHATLHEAGSLIDEAAVASGLKVKPSIENDRLRTEFGIYDRDRVSGTRAEEMFVDEIRQRWPELAKSPTDLRRVMNLMEAGGDESVLAHRYNLIAESAGMPNRLPVPDGTPIGGIEPERLQKLIKAQWVEAKYNPIERFALLDSYDPTKLTTMQRAMAKALGDHFAETLEKAQQAGVLDEGVANYVTHIWQDEAADNPAVNRILHRVRAGDFSTNTSMARQRLFENAFEGQLYGKKLAVTDPIALAAHNGDVFSRIIAARDTLQRLQDKGVRASDGRPLVALAGTGRIIESQDGESPAVLVNPNGIRSIRIADKVIQGLKKSGDLDRLVENGTINQITDKSGNDFYSWNTADYKTLDHPAFRGWNYAAAVGDTPVLVNADLRVHPEAQQYLERRLGLETGLSESAPLRAALKAGAEAKGVLLFGSPFHVFQEGLRAIMTGISPFGIEKWDLRTDPVLAKGVEAGLTLGKDYHAVTDWQEGLAGHSKIIKSIPGLKDVQDAMQTFLFDKYIPGLKARAFRALFDRYRSAYPEWTSDRVAQVAAADTNERFGGINYKQMGRAALSQDTLRLVTLAPDWFESEVRAIARVFGSEGKVARVDMLRMAAGTWAAARVLNLLSTGKPHFEAPFGVALKDKDGKEKVISIRTLPTDLLHAATDPVGFLRGRSSPLVRTFFEAYSGRDDYGKKLPNGLLFADVTRNLFPIPFQTAIKTSQLTRSDQLIKTAGFTVAPYRSEAMKIAAELASDHTPQGVVDADQLRRHQAILELEDGLNSGRYLPDQIGDLVQGGSLSVPEAHAILRNYGLVEAVKQAAGVKVSAEDARLLARAAHLPMPAFFQVWDAATPHERAVLALLLRRKVRSYLTKLGESQPMAMWPQDAIFRRLQAMFPNELPAIPPA